MFFQNPQKNNGFNNNFEAILKGPSIKNSVPNLT